MKNKLTYLIILIGLIIITGCQKSDHQQVIQPIKIGVITPLTGPASEYGAMAKKGIDLALQEINSINNQKAELIYEDSQCDPKIALNAYTKLITRDQVDIVIGTICSSVMLGLGPQAEQDKTLLISACSSNPDISYLGEYIFRVWPSDALQGKVLANFINQKFNNNKIGMLFINNDYGLGLKNSFIQNYSTPITSYSFEPEASDFKTQLTKLKEENVNLVLLASYATEMGRILKQARELDYQPQFIGGEGTYNQTIIHIAGPAAEGLIGTEPFSPTSQTRDNFLRNFQNTYPETIGTCADAAYDILHLLRKAAKDCDSDLTSTCLKDGLYKIQNFEGASGKITFDQNGDIQKGYKFIQVKDGEFVDYE